MCCALYRIAQWLSHHAKRYTCDWQRSIVIEKNVKNDSKIIKIILHSIYTQMTASTDRLRNLLRYPHNWRKHHFRLSNFRMIGEPWFWQFASTEQTELQRAISICMATVLPISLIIPRRDVRALSRLGKFDYSQCLISARQAQKLRASWDGRESPMRVAG